jgi:hypothetical protein
MKKILVSTGIALLLLIVLASTTTAAPAAAERQLLFKGSLQAVQTQQVVFPTAFVNGAGSGNATQLGLFSVSFQAAINVPTLAGSGSATWLAADGSTLLTETLGQGTPTSDPNVVALVELHTITGGTGRFADASGSFTVERLVDRTTGISSGTLSGTIVLP